MHDDAARMFKEARGRIHDAALLSQSLSRATDSDAFLRILGFEILLKCALVVGGVKPARNHKYVQLWRELPSDAQASILAGARARMPGHADLSDLDNLLNWYQFVFEKARYHYELYKGYSLVPFRSSSATAFLFAPVWAAAGSVMLSALVFWRVWTCCNLTTRSTRTPTGGAARLGGRRLPWFVSRHLRRSSCKGERLLNNTNGHGRTQ